MSSTAKQSKVILLLKQLKMYFFLKEIVYMLSCWSDAWKRPVSPNLKIKLKNEINCWYFPTYTNLLMSSALSIVRR